MSESEASQPFIFTVGSIPISPKYKAFLIADRWDDWFEFETMFTLVVFDQSGERYDFGSVKIGQFDMQEKQRRPALPNAFESLDESFFSLGQDESYYEMLGKINPAIREKILSGLRDVVVDTDLWEKAHKERVTKVSLLRSVTIKSVQGQFKRLVHGGARLSDYKFAYTSPKRMNPGQVPMMLSFDVLPESYPPTNIHVIIGRNGVGKTHMLNNMTRALVGDPATARQSGSFASENESIPFANLVSVTFSAFDPFEPIPEKKGGTDGMRYSYIGLKRANDKGGGSGSPKTPKMLAGEFVRSVRLCLQGARAARWRRALEKLEADPIFREAEVSSLSNENTNESTDEEFEKRASALFGKLSSGHAIVLLTITRLVETVEEQTLVLLDEPEAHLHPPLLSAFVRTLSDLLINRNGVAIIATHSPVVLQEVPKNCVWKLRRTGYEAIAERPEIETFGENVGVLTREVFALEVTQTGFHKMLSDAIEDERNYETILRRFNNALGAEARAIARALITNRNSRDSG